MTAAISVCAIQSQDLIQELVKLSKIKEMKIAIRYSLQAGLIVGGITTISSLFAGPLGIPIGGIVGAGIATYLEAGKFKSATEVIMYDITDEQREDLAKAVRKVLTPQNIMTLAHFIIAMQANEDVIELVLNTVKSYFTSELHMSIK